MQHFEILKASQKFHHYLAPLLFLVVSFDRVKAWLQMMNPKIFRL